MIIIIAANKWEASFQNLINGTLNYNFYHRFESCRFDKSIVSKAVVGLIKSEFCLLRNEIIY